MIYYKNGKALKFWYENHNISIANATTEDSGTYYCTGTLSQNNYTSSSLKITVIKGELVKEMEGTCSRGRERRHLNLK